MRGLLRNTWLVGLSAVRYFLFVTKITSGPSDFVSCCCRSCCCGYKQREGNAMPILMMLWCLNQTRRQPVGQQRELLGTSRCVEQNGKRCRVILLMDKIWQHHVAVGKVNKTMCNYIQYRHYFHVFSWSQQVQHFWVVLLQGHCEPNGTLRGRIVAAHWKLNETFNLAISWKVVGAVSRKVPFQQPPTLRTLPVPSPSVWHRWQLLRR